MAGETAPAIVDGTCATLSVDTAGLSLSEKAQRCYDILYRAAHEGVAENSPASTWLGLGLC